MAKKRGSFVGYRRLKNELSCILRYLSAFGGVKTESHIHAPSVKRKESKEEGILCKAKGAVSDCACTFSTCKSYYDVYNID